MEPPKKQRAKRLTPRFYPSKKRWCVDLPADMNAGARGKKFFKTQDEAFRWIGKRSLKVSLGLPLEKLSAEKTGSTVRALAQNYMARLVERRLSSDGIKQVNTCLKRFINKFGGLNIKAVEAEALEAWILSIPYGTRTRWNHYSQVRQFFNWKDVRRHVPMSPFEDIEAPPKTDKDGRLEILTPAEMAQLLALEVEPWVKVKIVLGGFAGLRTCEIAKMGYDSIDAEFEEIIVRKEESKQGLACRPRSVTLQPAVTRHLPTGEGPFISDAKAWRHHRGMPEVAKLGRGRFPQNALRHSFASYHLAHFKSPEKTAFEMGHTSPRLIYETYANAVSRRDAEAWWAL